MICAIYVSVLFGHNFYRCVQASTMAAGVIPKSIPRHTFAILDPIFCILCIQFKLVTRYMERFMLRLMLKRFHSRPGPGDIHNEEVLS